MARPNAIDTITHIAKTLRASIMGAPLVSEKSGWRDIDASPTSSSASCRTAIVATPRDQ
jgi:hypothetical protein